MRSHSGGSNSDHKKRAAATAGTAATGYARVSIPNFHNNVSITDGMQIIESLMCAFFVAGQQFKIS
jgi:hypothetical protein